MKSKTPARADAYPDVVLFGGELIPVARSEVVAGTPEQHDKFNRAEIAKWIKVARETGIEPE